MLSRIIRSAGKLWKIFGSPLPKTMRFVRYSLFGPPLLDISNQTVSVIIPCHNYGSLLSNAIESVLKQSVHPKEILVIDDASTDNTAEIAALYADQGVSYMRVEHHNLAQTRNSAAAAVSSEFMLYLDADDYLPRTYIERCLEYMHDPAIGFVYGDIHRFGDVHEIMHPMQFDANELTKHNYIPSNALIRRRVFDLVGGYRSIPHSMEDWDFYRRASAFGYRGWKAKTHTFYYIHEGSILSVHNAGPHKNYLNDAALLHHPVSIFTQFPGRRDVFDRYLAGLLSSDIDHSQIHLWWYNTSTDSAFDYFLRTTLNILPFGSIRYSHAPMPENDTHVATLRAYNAMLQECSTEYVLTLQDDAELKPTTIRHLLETMDASTVAVTAPYTPKKETEVQEVNRYGFGCTLFRTHALKKIMPLRTEPGQRYDKTTFTQLGLQGKVLCNEDLEITRL